MSLIQYLQIAVVAVVLYVLFRDILPVFYRKYTSAEASKKTAVKLTLAFWLVIVSLVFWRDYLTRIPLTVWGGLAGGIFALVLIVFLLKQIAAANRKGEQLRQQQQEEIQRLQKLVSELQEQAVEDPLVREAEEYRKAAEAEEKTETAKARQMETRLRTEETRLRTAEADTRQAEAERDLWEKQQRLARVKARSKRIAKIRMKRTGKGNAIQTRLAFWLLLLFAAAATAGASAGIALVWIPAALLTMWSLRGITLASRNELNSAHFLQLVMPFPSAMLLGFLLAIALRKI